jgi:hypothetical protein
MYTKFLSQNLNSTCKVEDQGVDATIILQSILKKLYIRMRNGTQQGPHVDSIEHGNDVLSCTKSKAFPEH